MNKSTPTWLVYTGYGIYGYVTLEVLLCDLAAHKSEEVEIYQLAPGIKLEYVPVSEQRLRETA